MPPTAATYHPHLRTQHSLPPMSDFRASRIARLTRPGIVTARKSRKLTDESPAVQVRLIPWRLMTEAQGKRGRPRAKIKAGFAGLSSSCGDGAADGQRGRRRSVLGLGERIPQKGSRSGPAFPARATPDAPGRIRCGDFFQLSPSTTRKKSQMTNYTNQRFTMVANNDLGVYYPAARIVS